MVQKFNNVMHCVRQWIHVLTSYIAFCGTVKQQVWLGPCVLNAAFYGRPA